MFSLFTPDEIQRAKQAADSFAATIQSIEDRRARQDQALAQARAAFVSLEGALKQLQNA